jgi:hypothetical protein
MQGPCGAQLWMDALSTSPETLFAASDTHRSACSDHFAVLKRVNFLDMLSSLEHKSPPQLQSKGPLRQLSRALSDVNLSTLISAHRSRRSSRAGQRASEGGARPLSCIRRFQPHTVVCCCRRCFRSRCASLPSSHPSLDLGPEC